jgi:hypothetical protein
LEQERRRHPGGQQLEWESARQRLILRSLAQSQPGEGRNVKTFYSAQDIEALAGQGVRELLVDEDTVLTDLARDAAAQLGIRLVAPGRPAAAGAAPGPARNAGTVVPSGARPKGCQHGPLANGPAASGAAPAKSTGSSPVVDELVGAVRQLAGKQGRG